MHLKRFCLVRVGCKKINENICDSKKLMLMSNNILKRKKKPN